MDFINKQIIFIELKRVLSKNFWKIVKKQGLNTKTTENIVRWSGTWTLTLLWMIVVKQRTWNVRKTNHLEISQKIPKCWRFKSSSQQGDLCGRKIAHTETICRSQRIVLTLCTVCKQEQPNFSNSQEGTLTILTSEVQPSKQGSGSWLALRMSYRDPKKFSGQFVI